MRFGKPYRIRHLAINSSGRPPPLPMHARGIAGCGRAAPMPIEAGETLVTASVSGQIELAGRGSEVATRRLR
jgi:hypothetical protein